MKATGQCYCGELQVSVEFDPKEAVKGQCHLSAVSKDLWRFTERVSDGPCDGVLHDPIPEGMHRFQGLPG